MPASSNVAKAVLNEIGWDEGITIPVANEENKLLEDEASSIVCVAGLELSGVGGCESKKIPPKVI